MVKDTFGQIFKIVDVPSSGNSPHHLGPSADGKLLVGGGLLSLLKTQDTAFYFDTSDPYDPKFSHSNRGLLSSIVDEIRAKPDGYDLSFSPPPFFLLLVSLFAFLSFGCWVCVCLVANFVVAF